jgi:two-component system nitrate/nitrite response regulator NarL
MVAHGRERTYACLPVKRVEAPLTVVVVEDHPLYRFALEHAFAANDQIAVVGSFDAAGSGLDGILELRPDLALLDLHLPDWDAVWLIGQIGEAGLHTRAVVLSGDGDGPTVYAALGAGALGYLSKDLDHEALCSAVLAAGRGEVVVSRQLQGALSAEIQRQRQVADVTGLTAREVEVLSLAATGLSSPAIGRSLHVSETTVKTHFSNLYAKLGASNRAAAVARAIERGLIKSDAS